MPLPLNGPIGLGNIQTEFSGASPMNFQEYYKNGVYVTASAVAPNVPTSGPISISNFYGAGQ